MAPLPAPSISVHASPAAAERRRGFGPRLRALHARIGKAHHQAEGIAFSRSLLAGQAEPLQLAALIRALAPAYALLERQAPALADRLGGGSIPWADLARGRALDHDLAVLSAQAATPDSPAAAAWLERLEGLADQAPHRLIAHGYVRYGGDLSGGQQLGQQANRILARHGIPALSFWTFQRPVEALKRDLHDGLEAMRLSPEQEQELLEEAEQAFLLTQRLLAELGAIGPLDRAAAVALGS